MNQKTSVTCGTLLNRPSIAVSAWCVVAGIESSKCIRKYEKLMLSEDGYSESNVAYVFAKKHITALYSQNRK
jgi:hypothetical protein